MDIKPITVFVGENSSGKSSCIHALACLSQTVKVVSDSRPIILDDESAHVHLGRFIEVIHSKSYQDQIGLGVTIPNVTISEMQPDTEEGSDHSIKNISRQSDVNSFYQFKCSKRTQDVTLESLDITAQKTSFTPKKLNLNTRCHLAVERSSTSLRNFSFQRGFLLMITR
ncbi:AAA family ATPase [Tamilnaduibacter salinus]|uniref:AAA family ATPase n=1 Tax=Tamilnaduibacter salinus TaxID=1484056 RepID=UPI000E3293DF